MYCTCSKVSVDIHMALISWCYQMFNEQQLLVLASVFKGIMHVCSCDLDFVFVCVCICVCVGACGRVCWVNMCYNTVYAMWIVNHGALMSQILDEHKALMHRKGGCGCCTTVMDVAGKDTSSCEFSFMVQLFWFPLSWVILHFGENSLQNLNSNNVHSLPLFDVAVYMAVCLAVYVLMWNWRWYIVSKDWTMNMIAMNMNMNVQSLLKFK